jgi:hypothetical protein
MTTDPYTMISNTIRSAALAKGYSDAAVVPQYSRERKDSFDSGNWFVLSVKRQAGDDWEVRGRRRTAGELSQLL